MYEVRLLDGAIHDLKRLDKPVAQRIVKRLNWLAENYKSIRPERLAGDLAGFFKFRVGNYRVLYEPLPDENVLIVHQIGHRRDIYRN